LTLPQPVKEMVAKSWGKIGPLNFWHSFSEGHSGELFFQILLFFRVSRFAQPISQFKELALLLFF
jgi:hypothetical protein